jgi:hypothetical protein
VLPAGQLVHVAAPQLHATHVLAPPYSEDMMYLPATHALHEAWFASTVVQSPPLWHALHVQSVVLEPGDDTYLPGVQVVFARHAVAPLFGWYESATQSAHTADDAGVAPYLPAGQVSHCVSTDDRQMTCTRPTLSCHSCMLSMTCNPFVLAHSGMYCCRKLYKSVDCLWSYTFPPDNLCRSCLLDSLQLCMSQSLGTYLESMCCTRNNLFPLSLIGMCQLDMNNRMTAPQRTGIALQGKGFLFHCRI